MPQEVRAITLNAYPKSLAMVLRYPLNSVMDYARAGYASCFPVGSVGFSVWDNEKCSHLKHE